MKRTLSATALFALIVWGCTVLGGLLHAQDNNQTPANPAVSAGQPLTDESLNQMLENLGFEPKKLSKGYLISIKQDTWTLNIQLVLSSNAEKLGMNANLGKVEDPASVTASQWMGLLVANGDVDPSAFYFDKDQNKLYLHRSVDNRAVTPAFLRKQIEAFASNIRSTELLWKFTK